MPSFSMTPARITEPAVGASVWASGSQVCSGNSGTLTAKAMAKAEEQPAGRRRWRSPWSSAIVDEVEGEVAAGALLVQDGEGDDRRPA